MFKPCGVVERIGHFDGIVPSLACIPTKQHGVCGGKYLLKTPGNAISETLNFKISLDALALSNLCLWFEFQSCLQFIISLLIEKFLTALTPPCKQSLSYTCLILVYSRKTASVVSLCTCTGCMLLGYSPNSHTRGTAGSV